MNSDQTKRRFYVKHENMYLSSYDPDVVNGVSAGWEMNPANALSFATRIGASRLARAVRNGPRQFAGLGSESRVVSRRS